MLGLPTPRLNPYWVARGLVLVVVGDQWITPTGTRRLVASGTPRQITTPRGQVIGYGSTDAGNTTSRLGGLSLPNSQRGPRSYFGTVLARSTGGGGLGRAWQDAAGAGGATVGEESMYFVGGRLTLTKVGNATGSLQVAANTSTPLGTWSSFGFSCNFVPNAAMAAADITCYQNGVRDTTFVNNAAAQNYPDGASTTFSFGNRPSDNARTWDGQIGYVAVFDAILSDAEQAALHANPQALVQAPSLVGRSFIVAAAGGSQTLTTTRYDNAQTFYSATISQSGAAQTLSPARFDNSQTFYTSTVTPGVATLSPSLFTNSNTFYSHTLTLGVTLLPSLFTNSNVIYSASIAVGAVALSPARFDNSNPFYTATLSQAGSVSYPSADINANGWTPSSGSDLYAMIDETVLNRSDYITSPNLSNPVTLAWNPPRAIGDHEVSVDFDRTGANGQLRIVMLDSSGTTVGTSAWQAAPSSAATTVFTITTTGISDRFRIEVQP